MEQDEQDIYTISKYCSHKSTQTLETKKKEEKDSYSQRWTWQAILSIRREKEEKSVLNKINKYELFIPEFYTKFWPGLIPGIKILLFKIRFNSDFSSFSSFVFSGKSFFIFIFGCIIVTNMKDKFKYLLT